MVTVKEQDESWSALSLEVRTKIRELYKENPETSLETIFGKSNLVEGEYRFRFQPEDKVQIVDGTWIEILKPYMADGLKRYKVKYRHNGALGDILESEIGRPPKFKPGDKVIQDRTGEVYTIKKIRTDQQGNYSYEVKESCDILKEFLLSNYSKFIAGDRIIFISSSEIGRSGRIIGINGDEVDVIMDRLFLERTFDKNFLEDNAEILDIRGNKIKDYIYHGQTVYLKDIGRYGKILAIEDTDMILVEGSGWKRRYDPYGKSLTWPYNQSIYPDIQSTFMSQSQAWKEYERKKVYHSTYLDIIINLRTEGKTKYLGNKRIEFTNEAEALKYYRDGIFVRR